MAVVTVEKAAEPALAPVLVQVGRQVPVGVQLLEQQQVRQQALPAQRQALLVLPCRAWPGVHAEQAKRNHIWAVISP